MSDTPELIRSLQAPACYDHAADTVRMIETHISWVLLTGEFAYKIKKPLNLGFLDFSSLDKRLHACRDEVQLNRRLAPAIYLDVVPITGTPAAPCVNGTGEAFEFAVKLRQFPPDATLDRLDAQGGMTAQHVESIATTRNATFRILDFPVPVATLRERIVERSRAGTDASEADLAVLQHQLGSEEPLAANEQADIVRIDA